MLTRWDPFRDMFSMRRQMDRMMNDMLGEEGSNTGQGDYLLPLDVSENDDHYLVKASLPGVKPDNIDVTYRNGTLTISAESKQEQEFEKEQYHIRERSYGTFRRSINLPGDIDPDKIDARFEDGVLTLTLPKSEQAKPKRISIKGQGEKKMIEGQFNHEKSK